METCADGAALIFSRLEVKILARDGLTLSDDKQAASELLKLAKGLFRLDEVEKIAEKIADERIHAIAETDMTLDEKVQEVLLIDRVEIRLAYRLGLKDRLGLPGQPDQARFTAVADVTAAMLDDAQVKVLAMDNSPAEIDATTQRDFWQTFLKRKYASKFEEALAPTITRLETLADIPGAMTSEEFRLKNEALLKEYRDTEAGVMAQLTKMEMSGADTEN